jgi:cobalamin biosynthesis Mg chelatase CobN
MGFRYRKRIQILPFVYLNISARGVSLSFGRRGAHYTVSSTGKRTASVGLPGTGMSYTKTSRASSGGTWLFWIVAALAAAAILGWIWWQSRQPPVG